MLLFFKYLKKLKLRFQNKTVRFDIQHYGLIMNVDFLTFFIHIKEKILKMINLLCACRENNIDYI